MDYDRPTFGIALTTKIRNEANRMKPYYVRDLVYRRAVGVQ